MTRYITVRLTLAQAQAACNAADVVRDQLEADGDKREASLYARASDTIGNAIADQASARDHGA